MSPITIVDCPFSSRCPSGGKHKVTSQVYRRHVYASVNGRPPSLTDTGREWIITEDTTYDRCAREMILALESKIAEHNTRTPDLDTRTALLGLARQLYTISTDRHEQVVDEYIRTSHMALPREDILSLSSCRG